MRKINVSNGEVIDKFTILAIKKKRIADKDKLSNIEAEHSYLQPIVNSLLEIDAQVLKYYIALQQVNNSLWDIEDRIRELESLEDFGDEFVQVARSVYKTNDQRAMFKKKINEITSSGLTEEKSYYGT